jgi:protein O-GlcNAc transferase
MGKKIKRNINRAKGSAKSKVKVTPASNQEMLNEAFSLFQSNDLTACIKSCDKILKAHPKEGMAWNIRGVAKGLNHQPAAAVKDLTRAVQLSPDKADFVANLAIVLKQNEQFDEAAAQFQRAHQLAPNHAGHLFNWGNLLKALGQFPKAAKLYERALLLNPKNAGMIHNNAALCYREMQQPLDAIRHHTRSIQCNPDHYEYYNNLANTYRDLERTEDAKEAFRNGMKACPQSAYKLSLTYGSFLREELTPDNMLEVLNQELDETAAKEFFADIWSEHGVVDETIALEDTIVREQYSKVVECDLLFNLPYDPVRSPEDIYAPFCRWNQRVMETESHKQIVVHAAPKKEDKIRIGYVSPDFNNHVMQFVMEPLLQHANKDMFEIYAYAEMRNAEDNTTRRLKQYCSKFTNTKHLSDDQMAEQIRQDGIDILVDWAGHTGGNRLQVFAQKPAPVQAAWCVGTAYTTGLETIDYFIAHEDYVPKGDEKYYGEREIYRLPHVPITFRPNPAAPAIPSLGLRVDPAIRFGCQSRVLRLNDRVFSVWKDILNAVPNSTLTLDQKVFLKPHSQDYFRKRLEKLGFPIDRVQFIFSENHWVQKSEFDIALDPFPHNAGSTTLESLWMGIPVVTMLDRLSVGRIGNMIMRAIGYPQWIAKDNDEYVEIAVRLAMSRDERIHARMHLREAMQASALLDEKGFVGDLEDAYQTMWHRYCDRVGTAKTEPLSPPVVQPQEQHTNKKISGAPAFQPALAG